MGKKWDYDVPSVEIWKECLRVLKPGGTALIFAGSRTQHRMAVNVEEAGFILKDTIMWLYGSGFPKATDISKQLDKGHERKVKEHIIYRKAPTNHNNSSYSLKGNEEKMKREWDITEPATLEAKLWNGWKSHGLKPAVEPILSCFKPLTIEQYFAILTEDITNSAKILCQNSNVKDAEKIFSDTQAKLKKVLEHIVVENVKINLWENLENVRFVEKNFMSKNVGLKIQNSKQDFVPTSVKENGKVDITKKKVSRQQKMEDTGEKATQLGRAEDILTKIMDISTFVIMGNMSLNTALLWKSILEDLLKEANTLTTKTAIKLITGLRTLKFSLTPNTSKGIGNLYPNYCPIIVAMKPNEGTYAQNALKWGVSGLNIDGGRIEFNNSKDKEEHNKSIEAYRVVKDSCEGSWKNSSPLKNANKQNIKGRFPANIILDEEAARLLDEQSGVSKSSGGRIGKKDTSNIDFGLSGKYQKGDPGFGDKGGASRFFYVVKASKAERNMGLEGFILKEDTPREIKKEIEKHLISI